MRRVVITGLGLVTPLGVGTAVTWEGLLTGRSAVGPLTNFDPSSLRTRIGGEIAGFNAKEFVANRRLLRSMTRGDQLATSAAVLAVRDAGLDFAAQDPDRAGLFVGGNKEVADPMRMLDAVLTARGEDGTADIRRFGAVAPGTVYPLFFIEGLQAAVLFYISDAYGLKGANTYFSGTADAGATAIGRGYRAVRRGEADIVIAGGFDDAVSWWHMSKCDDLGLLTGRNELGAAACQPFDRDRDGTVFGEGAAFVVLEEYAAARRRGATPHAEVVGFGSAFDPSPPLQPHPNGPALVHAVGAALREAGAGPADIGYAAAHGDGTPCGDRSEAHGLHAALGTAGRTAISSVTPATGNLVAAAGALNVGVAALAVRDQVAPPTLNLHHPDPPADGNWITGEARQLRTTHTLALSRGFTGQHTAIVLRAMG